MINLCTGTTIQHWYSKWNFSKPSANSAFSFLGIGPQTKTRNRRKIKFEFFLTENLWKDNRVSLGIILRLFYQQRKEIMIFRGFCRFREFRGIDLASFSSNLSENFSIIHLLLFYQRRGLMMIKLTWIRYFIFQIIVSSMKKEKLTIKVED